MLLAIAAATPAVAGPPAELPAATTPVGVLAPDPAGMDVALGIFLGAAMSALFAVPLAFHWYAWKLKALKRRLLARRLARDRRAQGDLGLFDGGEGGWTPWL